MGRRPPSAGRLLYCALLLAAASSQKPGVVSGEGILILPVDPCELLSNRRIGGIQTEGIDRASLQVLAQGCLSRAKRAASGYAPGRPKARDTRGLFLKAAVAQGGLIYPGTKWCGPGNAALNYWDLGKLEDEDRCCRMHDYCPDNILAGRCSHGICNTAPFTRSHCSCDEHFRQCLQALKSPAADNIGALYFNVGNALCFAEDEENDLPVNAGYADILEDRFGIDLEGQDLWPSARSNFNANGQRQSIGCSRSSNCRYKFYAQKHYTEAASGDNVIPNAVQRSRNYQHDVNSQQLNLVMDKRSTAEDVDHQAAEILSKFFHRILRSTGILRPRI